MIVAVAADGNEVTNHFGYCEKFVLFTAEDRKILKKETVASPGHQPGLLPNFLNDRGVNAVIAGSMGASARQLFGGFGIEVISGAAGDIDSAAEGYLNGTLKSNDSVCTEHEHSGNCGEHGHTR